MQLQSTTCVSRDRFRPQQHIIFCNLQSLQFSSCLPPSRPISQQVKPPSPSVIEFCKEYSWSRQMWAISTVQAGFFFFFLHNVSNNLLLSSESVYLTYISNLYQIWHFKSQETYTFTTSPYSRSTIEGKYKPWTHLHIWELSWHVPPKRLDSQSCKTHSCFHDSIRLNRGIWVTVTKDERSETVCLRFQKYPFYCLNLQLTKHTEREWEQVLFGGKLSVRR